MNKIEWGIIYAVSTVIAIWWWKSTPKFEKSTKEYIARKIEKSKLKKKRFFTVVFGEIIVWSISIIFVIFIQQLYLGNFKVPTGSMEPTIEIGDKFFSNMFMSKFKFPARDSIIMFTEPVAEKLKYCKRVVGLPGDTVQISDNGYLLINDISLKNQRKYTKAGVMGENTWKIPRRFDKITLLNPIIKVKSVSISLNEMKNKIESDQIKDFDNIVSEKLSFTINGKKYKKGLFSYITDFEEIKILLKGEILNKNGNKIRLLDAEFFSTEIVSNLQKIKNYLNEDFELVGGEFKLNGKDLTGPISNKEILLQLLEGKSVELRENYYFVLGDNTNNSEDSRFWGFVKESAIKGNLIVRYWPLNRIRIMAGE